MRRAASLAVLDPDPTVAVGALVRAQHVASLRNVVAAARLAIGVPAVAFTDPSLTPGTTPVKALHLQELRDCMN